MTEKREVIREGDYYGGDLWVESSEEWSNFATIVWEAWGRYGGAEITLNIHETKQVAEALMKVYDEAPDHIWKEPEA